MPTLSLILWLPAAHVQSAMPLLKPSVIRLSKQHTGRCWQRRRTGCTVQWLQTWTGYYRGNFLIRTLPLWRLVCKPVSLITANYEPKDEAHFWVQLAMGLPRKIWSWLTAILWLRFRPGCKRYLHSYAAKHHFDEIHYLDIVGLQRGRSLTLALPLNFNPKSTSAKLRKRVVTTKNGQWWETGSSGNSPTHYFTLTWVLKNHNLLYHEELNLW